MPNNKQYISFGTSAGICNRIKRLASALRFEVDKTRPLDFYWSISDLCNHSFKELFIYEPYDVNEITCKVKVELDDAHDVGHNNGWRLVIKDGEVPSGFTKAFKKDADDKEYIDFEYNRIPRNVLDAYLPFFSNLKPSAEVYKRIKSVNIPDNAVSVHVRQGRFWTEYNRGDNDSVKHYIDVMKEYSEDIVFFLAAANEVVAERIKKEFPNRIIELPNKDFDDAIDAVAELYLLGSTGELIATYGSTFSEVAWWLGGCKQKVTVIGAGDDWEIKCPICKSEADLVKEYPRKECLRMYRHLYKEVPDDLEIVDYQMYRCKKCKLVFANPLKGGSQSFYSWVTSHENYYPTKEKPRWEWEEIRKYALYNSVNSLIEVGCGTGEFLDYMQEKVNIDMVGLDTTINSYKQCIAKGHKAYNEPLEKYILRSDEKYDIAVAFHLLEHVENPLELVQDMMQLVKKGGKCMLSFPYSAEDIETCFTTSNNMPPHHVTRWSLNSIRELAEAVKANYEIVAPYANSLKADVVSDLRNEFFPLYRPEPSKKELRRAVVNNLGRSLQILKSEKNKGKIPMMDHIGGEEITRRPPWFVLVVFTHKCE